MTPSELEDECRRRKHDAGMTAIEYPFEAPERAAHFMDGAFYGVLADFIAQHSRPWTREAPKETGFFWNRRPGRKDTIEEIRAVHDGSLYVGYECEAPGEMGGEWNGPILPP